MNILEAQVQQVLTHITKGPSSPATKATLSPAAAGATLVPVSHATAPRLSTRKVFRWVQRMPVFHCWLWNASWTLAISISDRTILSGIYVLPSHCKGVVYGWVVPWFIHLWNPLSSQRLWGGLLIPSHQTDRKHVSRVISSKLWTLWLCHPHWHSSHGQWTDSFLCPLSCRQT